MKKFFLFIILFLSLQPLYAQRSKSLQPENKIKNYVTDKTGTLSSSQVSDLEKKLSDFDKQTSTQVVVYVISSLNGDALEEKSIEIAEQNGIGKKSKNNGVLLFIVKDDRKLRIEVGYGLEGALPDALCDQIIRKEITPYFKQGKYYDGINAGIDAIIKATKGEYTQDKNDNKSSPQIGFCGLPIIISIIFGLVFVFILIAIVSRLCRMFGGGRSYTGSPFGWSSGSSSWGSSGSSWSGGGFSGGGGSFGGGGASGSW